MKKIIFIAIAIVVVGLGAWYWSYYAKTPVKITMEISEKITMATATTLTPRNDARFGGFLVGKNGMTVYTYSKDTSDVSNCYDTCAKNWPPYIVSSEEVLGSPKIDIGPYVKTITRQDGSLQVTYKGLPLYFWSKDVKPSDTTGDGVGGLWSVVKYTDPLGGR